MKPYLKRFAYIFKPYKKQIVIIFIFIILESIISYFQPFISKDIVDVGLQNKNIKALILFCGALFGLAVVRAIIECFKERVRVGFGNGVKYGLEKQTFLHLIKIEMNYYNDKNASMIHQNINYDLRLISNVASSMVFQVLTSLFTAIAGAIALVRIEWRLIIVILIFVPINCLVTMKLSKKNYEVTSDYIDSLQSYNSWFADSLTGFKEIRLFGLQKKKEDLLKQKQSNLIELDNKHNILTVIHTEVMSVVFTSISVAIYIVSGFLMLHNGITLGEVIAFQTYALLISNPIIEGFGMIMSAAELAPSIKRFIDFTDYKEEKNDGVDCQGFENISFENVSFSYDDEKVFDDLSFDIEKGSKVAILGENGAGKTTLINLMLRLLYPEEGSIYCNGKKIDQYNMSSYRELFSVVPQNVYLFNMSLKDNICLYKKVDEEVLNNVIKQVKLDDLVGERGLDINVGENGAMLSGGQKQKIAIARALILDRPVIIFDEATSNLDRDTVDIITQMFETTLKDKTIICITHSDKIEECFTQRIYV